MKDMQFQKILDRFGFSWAGFRKVRKGVMKRLSRHMQETGCQKTEDYIEIIERDRNVRFQFEQLMTVSISRFFRDQELWKCIKGQILPVMAQKPCMGMKAWFAGCASGEEVYSFKILWEDLRKSCPYLPNLSILILATDLNPAYLERAEAAVYPRSSVKDVPEAIRAVYFMTSTRETYALSTWMKEGIVWKVHHLLYDPPGTAFDLIFLRNNLLTYYRDEIKMPALKKVIDSLADGGFLVIGSHERMPVERPDLIHWQDCPYIFHRQN